MFISKNDEMIAIKFFTAYPYWKQQSYIRHKNYMEILQDMGVEIILGNFKRKQVFCSVCRKNIEKHEEKQTDVNIATHILQDLYENKPDIIHIISGDTDLIPPLKIAYHKGVKIYVTIPHRRKANEYDNIAAKKSKIKLKHLQECFIGSSYTTANNKILQCPYPLNS